MCKLVTLRRCQKCHWYLEKRFYRLRRRRLVWFPSSHSSLVFKDPTLTVKISPIQDTPMVSTHSCKKERCQKNARLVAYAHITLHFLLVGLPKRVHWGTVCAQRTV